MGKAVLVQVASKKQRIGQIPVKMDPLVAIDCRRIGG